jgi:hypothetical protein
MRQLHGAGAIGRFGAPRAEELTQAMPRRPPSVHSFGHGSPVDHDFGYFVSHDRDPLRQFGVVET